MACTLGAAQAFASPATLVTREAGRLVAHTLDGSRFGPAQTTSDDRVPLGSIWKLFVAGYLIAERIDAPDYPCTGHDKAEVYCCTPGERIGRDMALIRSCGLYFAPARLSLDPSRWASFWRDRKAPPWLTHLASLGEATPATPGEIIAALEAIPPDARERLADTLLGLLGTRQAGNAILALGGQVRAKTWSMPGPTGRFHGGAAGWFANGQPFWMGGTGSGIRVLAHQADALATYAQRLPSTDDVLCVDVRFFARYPIRRLDTGGHRQPVEGALRGHYRVHFDNGNQIDIDSAGELRATRHDQTLMLTGRFGLNEYVARVIDREAAATPTEAARALAVVARSYVLRNARAGLPCMSIDDSTRYQRVAPRPASAAARAIADWSDGLTLGDTPVRFHQTERQPGVLSWATAKQQAEDGASFIRILGDAFPGASLGGTAGTPDTCERTPQGQAWLDARAGRWRTRLAAEPGFDPPPRLPTVCMTRSANPFSDPIRQRIYTRGWARMEDRIALAHEYLHLAFDGHPTGLDEARIETLARSLIMESPP